MSSVVIRTIGRPEHLAGALASLDRCDPKPDEVLVVDQSEGTVAAIIERAGARRVASKGRGPGLAFNEGLEAATHDTVFVLDDDCTARADWIAVGSRALEESPGSVATGQVLPAGPLVPSLNVDPEAHDYTGQVRCDVLWMGNMVCSRSAVLALGGADERIVPAAEDCDLCYRWLRSGGRLRHVPELVVTHHGARAPEELERLYIGYARGQGLFYAKHLRAGDWRVARFIATDVEYALRATYAARFRGRPRWDDPRRGIPRGLPAGLRQGWRTFT